MFKHFLPAFVLVAAVPALAAPLSPAQKAEIDRIALDVLKKTDVPSASIAVVTDGKLQYARAYGRQRLDASPPTVTARYPIASNSKQITAAAILLLAEEGKLSLDDPVGKYLPDLTDADHITIRQILSHTSGYRDFWPQNYAFSDMRHAVTPQQILDRWAKAPLDFAPGSQWQYSNTGYVAAGRIIEKVSGEPLMKFLEARIFRPLGLKMVDADYDLTPADAKGFTSYALGPVRPAQVPGAGWLFAAGQLATTPTELAKWDIARLDRSLLKPESWAAQETAVKLTDGSSSDYGLGVRVDRIAGHPRIEHGGAAEGYLSENRVYPADKAAIVVFVNADFGNAQAAIADRLEAMLIGDDPDTRPARAIFDALRSGNVDRSRFTAHFNAYLTPEALADYRTSLSALGEPESFVRFRPAKMRGGFTTESFLVSYPNRKLIISLRAEPNGGKVEEFLVYPYSG